MKVTHAFVRTLMVLLSILFITIYFINDTDLSLGARWGLGLGVGAAYGLLLVGIDQLFKRFNLRLFNTGILGLFFGFLLGLALVLIFDAIIRMTTLPMQPEIVDIVKIALFLFALYLGVMITLRSADELYVSLPFIRFEKENGTGRSLLVDGAALADPRLLGLVNSGLLDKMLVVPRFVVRELDQRRLETLQTLEETAGLDLRYDETDFPDVPDTTQKLLRLARLLGGDLLTAQVGGIKGEEIRIVNLHTLATILKPVESSGETLTLRIQRIGKEPDQGVGYLEDGTMVVVNGGREYIGEEVQARVLSVKHTAAGRLIFCNLLEE